LAVVILWPTALASEPWEDEMVQCLELSPSGRHPSTSITALHDRILVSGGAML